MIDERDIDESAHTRSTNHTKACACVVDVKGDHAKDSLVASIPSEEPENIVLDDIDLGHARAHYKCKGR